MLVINRLSKELEAETDLSKHDNHVRVGGKEIYFTSLASINCGISRGKFVHFINDGADWSFYVNDDEDGFVPLPVNFEGVKRQNYRINSVGLVNMILKSFGFKNSKKFLIEETNVFMDGNKVFKLYLDRISQ